VSSTRLLWLNTAKSSEGEQKKRIRKKKMPRESVAERLSERDTDK